MLPAFVLTLGGLALAYLPVTFGWADLPDAVSLAPMFLGAVWAWSVARKRPGRVRLLTAVLLTLLPAAYTVWAFGYARYEHPDAAVGLGARAPDIYARRARDGAHWQLAGLRGQDVLLVFFRGAW
ncbi:MAG: hypothetical protein V3T86_13465 [Planctomycetota bacterium]